MPESSQAPTERYHLPHWVKETVYVAGFLITATIAWQDLKADQRSNRERDEEFRQYTREQIEKMSSDLQSIRAQMPNREASELRMKQLENRMEEFEGDLKFEAAKTQSLRERLIKKGWID